MADFLTIGTSGLQAYRRSLEVTGNNIVNANTEGYARRDVQLQGVGDASSSPTNVRTGSGSGVAVDLVRRASDVFVQTEKRLTQSASSAATALSDRLDRLEKSMFSGDGDLGKLSQTLFSRLQDFATTPSSIAVRTTVIQSANDLAGGFNIQAQRLANESAAIVTDAQSQFDNLNALTNQLANLNKQIESIGSDQGKANDLLDQRDKLVDDIVKIVGVTVESRPSGAVNLYLSNGTGGPQLVGPNGAKTLQASRVNGHLQITMDPYNTNIPIAKISGGAVGGIQSFDDQISSMTNQLDRMAVGFAKRMNDQHAKGTDLDGKRGLQLFSTDSFAISASKSNKGFVSASLDMGQVGSVELGDYNASFNQSNGKWSIVNQISGTKASGTETVAIDGMTIRFTGKPADGDSFTFSPLINAASGMRTLISDPRQLAASLPQLAEAAAANNSSAKIDIIDTGGLIDPPNVPSLSALFSQSLSAENAVTFKNDAIITAIPSGAKADPQSPVTLYSFGELSSATFKVDLNSNNWDINAAPSLNVVHRLDNLEMSIETDLGPFPQLKLFPDGIPASMANAPNSAQILADEINRILDSQTGNDGTKLSDALFASANGNYVTINGLGTHTIGYTVLKSNDGSNATISTATRTIKANAANLNIMTREGIQISGNSATKEALFKDQSGNFINGFLTTARISPIAPIPSDNLIKDLGFSEGKKISLTVGTRQPVDVVPLIDRDTTLQNLVESINNNIYLNPNGPATAINARISANGNLTIESTNGESLRLSSNDTPLAFQNLTGLSNTASLSGSGSISTNINFDHKSYSTYSYRNLIITDARSPVSERTTSTNFGRTSLISFDATPEADSAAVSPLSGSASPGAVYSLKVDGLSSPLRLAGGAIAGKGSADLAQMMLDKLNQLSPQRSIVGGVLDFSSDALANIGKASFNISIDGKAALVSFTRSTDANTGSYLPMGTFSVTWGSTVIDPPALNVTMKSKILAIQNAPLVSSGANNASSLTASLSNDYLSQNQPGDYKLKYIGNDQKWLLTRPSGLKAEFTSLPTSIDGMNIAISGIPSDGDSFTVTATRSEGRIMIDLPRSLSTTPPSLSITGPDIKTLGLSTDMISEQILAGSKLADAALLPAAKTYFQSKFGIDPNKVNLLDDGSIIISKSISDPSQFSALALTASNANDISTMASFGFLGCDLTATRQGNTLSISSTVAKSIALTDTSQSVSRLGHKVSILSSQNDPTIPEDLLVALQQEIPEGIRSVAARFDPLPARVNPTLPDIEAKVNNAGLLEIYALKTDANGNLSRDAKGDPIRGALIATRTYKPGVPIDYMGSKFVIEGNAAADDVFRITTDPNRTGDNRNAQALIDIGHNDLLNKGSGSFADIYSAAVSKIGSSTQAAKTSATAAKTVADNVAAAFDSATGVNLDTEAAELIKLQQAYSACAQIVSTARDLFNMLLKSF